MKTIIIEWSHLDINGETCNRCYDTGENLRSEIKRLNRDLNPKGTQIQLVEKRLDEGHIGQSNSILINGVPLETIIPIQIESNYCESCSSLAHKDTYCRTIIYDGNEYEEIPAKAIRMAVYRVLGIHHTIKQVGNDCSCKQKGCC